MVEKKVLKELELLDSDILKSKIELESKKEIFIQNIKKIKKEDILPKPPEPIKKLTLWERIRKVLMG
jgi:hypothetical protein